MSKRPPIAVLRCVEDARYVDADQVDRIEVTEGRSQRKRCLVFRHDRGDSVYACEEEVRALFNALGVWLHR